MFGFKKKKEKKEGKHFKMNGDLIGDMIIEKALRENQQKQAEIVNLESNIEVLQNSIEIVKEICSKTKSSKVAREILKELGE